MTQKRRMIRLVSGVLVCLCLLTGCAGGGEHDYFAFRRSSFSVEVRGESGGQRVCARLESRITENGERAVTLLYLSPPALEGLTLAVTYGTDGVLVGQARVECRALVTETAPEHLGGLLAPAAVLFDGGEVASLQKSDGVLRVSFADGRVLTLNQEGVPQKALSESLSVEFICFEALESRSDAQKRKNNLTFVQLAH